MSRNPFTVADPEFVVPEEWYDRHPVLEHIRQDGYWLSSPGGLYVHLLANAAAGIRPGILTPIGTEPNLWVGVIGKTGDGFSITKNHAEALLPPIGAFVCRGTWQGFAAAAGRDPHSTLNFFLDGVSLRHVLKGPATRRQMEALLDSDEIVHTKYGLSAGTYRVTLRESIYPPSLSGWVFMRQNIPFASRYLLASLAYCPFRGEVATRYKPFTIPETDWSGVPDGPLPMPPRAQAAADQLRSGAGDAVDLAYLKLRFTVLTAHAALLGRTVPTDEDWDATESVMHVSRSMAANYYELLRTCSTVASHRKGYRMTTSPYDLSFPLNPPLVVSGRVEIVSPGEQPFDFTDGLAVATYGGLIGDSLCMDYLVVMPTGQIYEVNQNTVTSARPWEPGK